MKALLALTALALTASPAFAVDSKHLVCSGYMNAAASPGPNNLGMSIQVDEFRAADGANRQETLSSVFAGKLYQGSRINRNNDAGFPRSILMVSEDTTKMYFRGDYFVGRDAAGNYVLNLDGTVDLPPGSQNYVGIQTTLPCVDISH